MLIKSILRKSWYNINLQTVPLSGAREEIGNRSGVAPITVYVEQDEVGGNDPAKGASARTNCTSNSDLMGVKELRAI